MKTLNLYVVSYAYSTVQWNNQEIQQEPKTFISNHTIVQDAAGGKK